MNTIKKLQNQMGTTNKNLLRNFGALMICGMTGYADLAVAVNDIGTTTRGTTGNLDMKLTNGEAEGYAFIKQIFPLVRGVRTVPEVIVKVQPDDSSSPFWEWTWEVFHEGPDTALAALLNFQWYGQASCPDDLVDFRISGSDGTRIQNPLTNPVYGYFNYQAFSVDTVENVCLNWATENNCDVFVPGQSSCELDHTFDLIGGSELAPDDEVLVNASCKSGPVAYDYVAPVMKLRCIRSGSF